MFYFFSLLFHVWQMYSTSLYEDIILSIASAPEISKFRDVVKASVLSLTIACFWPSSKSKIKNVFC